MELKTKEPYYLKRVVYGKGYKGGTLYSSVKDNKAYNTWFSMLRRCYCPKNLKNNTSYIGCVVEESWLNFQVFAEWFYLNYKEGYDLDKDILIKGNKLYSSSTCCFVPHSINALFLKSNTTRGEFPIGVIRNGKGYSSKFWKTSIICRLGTFKTPLLAFQAYKKNKELYIKELADKYKGTLTTDTYQALYNYSIDIND